ncbi:AAA family ATPase [Streptomyces sp. NPDC006476]|uniref:helix-turn-helix transcriptional regulator n=1 Tax=Streptomyces sp. NPDC006476 TaxID=3157175 RepID=UPI0033BB5761
MIVERDTEWAAIANALRRAEGDAGTVLIVTGPLGIGKSAVLHTLSALAGSKGAQVLSAQGAQAEESFPLGIALQLLEPALARATPSQREKWLAGIPKTLRDILDDRTAGDQLPPEVCPRLLAALESLVMNVADGLPLLILLDDVQWLDSHSLRWLNYVAKRIVGLPVVIVACLQEGDLRADRPLVRELVTAAQRVLRLQPLSQAGVRALIEQQYGASPDEAFVVACHQASMGNPLYATLVAAQIMSGTDSTSSPWVLRSALLADRLVTAVASAPSPIPEFTHALAVLGEGADVSLVAQLAHLDDVGAALAMRKLTQLGLLSPQSPPRFVNKNVWDSIRASAPMEQLERLRKRAAVLLHESGCPVNDVAEQLLLLTSRQGPWAVPVLFEAARQARERRDYPEAARCLRRALLEVSPDDELRGRLLGDMAAVERHYDPESSARHVLEAVSLQSSVTDRAKTLLQLDPWCESVPTGIVHQLLLTTANDLRDAAGLADLNRELPTRLEARTRYLEQGTPEGLASAAERLRRLGPEPPVSTPGERELAVVLSHAATVNERYGRAAVIRLTERILEREPGIPTHVHTPLRLLVPTLLAADSLGLITDWLDTAADFEESYTQEPGGRQGLGPATTRLLNAERTLVQVRRGNILRARRWAEAVTRNGDDSTLRCQLTISAVALTALEARDADLAEALLVASNRLRIKSAQCVHSKGLLHILRGMVALRDGKPHIALEEFHECGRKLEGSGWHLAALHPWRTFAAVLHYRLGDTDRAWKLVEDDWTAAEAWGAPAWIGRVIRTRAVLSAFGSTSAGNEELALLRQSVTVLRDSDHRLELARSLVRLGLRAPAPGAHVEEVHEAETPLAEGIQLAEACGVPELARRARSMRGGEQPPATVSSGGLTRTQLVISELAAQGVSNRDIAARLLVTQRAVEKHLTSVYRKLGIAGRKDLARALHEEGRDLSRSGGHL